MRTMTSFVIKRAFIVFAILSIHNGCSAVVEEQTMVAGYTDGDTLNLMNDKLISFYFNNNDGSFMFRGVSTRLGTTFVDEFFKLQAWVKTLNGSSSSYLLYTDKYGIFVDYSKYSRKNWRRLNYGPRREFIRHGGPDAAVRKDGKLMFFKGCEMVIRNKWYKWTKPTDVRKINLPCDVDAAWKVDDKALVLKGDQVWTWGPRDHVSGPVLFCDMYKCGNDFALKPKP